MTYLIAAISLVIGTLVGYLYKTYREAKAMSTLHSKFRLLMVPKDSRSEQLLLAYHQDLMDKSRQVSNHSLRVVKEPGDDR